MLAGILIIALSSALFVYWFRYSCVLILRNRSEIAAVSTSATVLDSRFSFAELRKRLNSEPTLDALQASLERDYRVLKYLIEHAAGLELASLEDRLLMLDYHIMQGVYQVTRTAAPRQARKALSEMASVLGVLAHSIGEQAGVETEA
jgi:hypothetical protein